jgi:hypothetical protein
MNASNDIRERVDRFVEEILGLIRRLQEEHRATALRTVTTMLADMRRPAARASSERRQKRQSGTTQRRKSVVAPAVGTKHAAASRPSSAWTPTEPTPSSVPASPSVAEPITAGAVTETATSTSEREAVVLETVRTLVRGTATEIATRSGLPNGSVYVALRSLVTRGRVARAETARGVEYSLVSTGEIRPFKRVRAAAPTSPADAERTADAAPVE